HCLPGSLREPLLRFRILQPAAIRALRDLAQAILQPDPPPAPAAPAPVGPAPVGPAQISDPEDAKEQLRSLAKPGDVLLVLGAMWFHQDYGRMLRRARCEYGMRTALL